ncbi:MAG: nitroreductase family protein [Spirochaetales bacterium]|nr:nitroreductase family protein [Spirochaetales bacterium]
MDFFALVKETRSIRRFREAPISRETLEKLVDCARFSPSGSNKQPLKFALFNEKQECARLFPLTRWAGALKEWDGPAEGERPSAYIVILLDTELSPTAGVDHGIAAQSMMLAARSLGLGCCMIGAFDKPGLIKEMSLSERFIPLLILALGEPGETIILEDARTGYPTTYYRDEEDNHHVPKRTEEELLWK